jgi:hypothetical protein
LLFIAYYHHSRLERKINDLIFPYFFHICATIACYKSLHKITVYTTVVTKRKEGGDSVNKFVPPKPEGAMKPPPEAIEACKGKSEGTAVQFITPRGDTFKGVCRQFEGILAAMPEQGAPPSGGNKSDEAKSGKQTD